VFFNFSLAKLPS